MKIPIRSIPVSGALDLEEKFEKDALDIGGPDFAPSESVLVKAQVSRGINNIAVKASISGSMQFTCSRCLATFKWPFKKNVKFNYEVKPTDLFIDINPDLREEIILDFPVKPLCKAGCKGLCLVCGEDLNAGKCKCQVKK